MTDVSCHHPCTWPDCTVTDQKPVAHQFQDRDGRWCNFMNDRHYHGTLADPSWPIRALYAAPPALPAQPMIPLSAMRVIAQEPRSTTCTMTDAPCTRNCGLACAMQMEALRQEPAQRLSESDVWINSAIMVANADAGLQMPVLMKLVRAIEAAICPPGYVVVPMEPTPEMVSAGWNYLPSAKGDWFIKNVWGAMIAAAQKATP